MRIHRPVYEQMLFHLENILQKNKEAQKLGRMRIRRKNRDTKRYEHDNVIVRAKGE